MLLGAWWGLILGLNNECDAALEAKLRTNKDYVNIDSEEFDEFQPAVPFRACKGVTNFLLVSLESVIALVWSSWSSIWFSILHTNIFFKFRYLLCGFFFSWINVGFMSSFRIEMSRSWFKAGLLGNYKEEEGSLN